MRHRKKTKKIGRVKSLRKSTLRSIARAILTQEQVKTTLVQAKATQPLVEHLITLGKHNVLANKRLVCKKLNDSSLVMKLFDEIAPRYSSRSSGYTRILPFGFRRGDGAKMAVFELTERKIEPKKQKKAKKESVSQPVEKPVKPEQKVPQKERTPDKFKKGIKRIFKKERDSR